MENKYLLSVIEASKRYGLGRDKLYQLIRTDPEVPTLKIGTITKINAPLFENYLNKCTQEGREL